MVGEVVGQPVVGQAASSEGGFHGTSCNRFTSAPSDLDSGSKVNWRSTFSKQSSSLSCSARVSNRHNLDLSLSSCLTCRIWFINSRIVRSSLSNWSESVRPFCTAIVRSFVRWRLSSVDRTLTASNLLFGAITNRS